MFNKTISFLSKHSSEFLTGFGIAFGITGVIFSVKGTIKATKIIEDISKKENIELTKKEIIKNTWKCYIPCALFVASSFGIFIYSSFCLRKRNAALATALGITEAALTEYKNGIVDLLGKRKASQIDNAIVKKSLESNKSDDSDIIITGKGPCLCYDKFTGRYFRSSIDFVKRAEAKINADLESGNYVKLNDYYYLLGLEEVEVGDILGWSKDINDFGLGISSCIAINNEPCAIFYFTKVPKSRF